MQRKTRSTWRAILAVSLEIAAGVLEWAGYVPAANVVLKIAVRLAQCVKE